MLRLAVVCVICLFYTAAEAAHPKEACSIVISEGIHPGDRTSHIRACELLIMAEDGAASAQEKLDAISPSEKEAAEKYVPEAKKLMDALARGDLSALVRAGVATARTNRAEYLKQIYKYWNITEVPEGSFPVKFFDDFDIPLPVHGMEMMAWLNEDTVIYPIKDDIVTVRLSDAHVERNRAKDEFQAALKRDITRFESSKFFVQMHNLMGSSESCIQHPTLNVQICYHAPLPDCEKNAWPHDCLSQPISDPKMVFVMRENEKPKKFMFDRPVYPLNKFRYEPFSKTYWVASGEKLWRFDERFSTVTEEIYPKALKGNAWCARVPWHYSWPLPCQFLETPVKTGFLSPQGMVVGEPGNSMKRVFEFGFLFLITKEGRVYNVLDDAIDYISLSVSPDGCRVFFLRRFSGTGLSSSVLHDSSTRAGLIDVCQYFDRAKKPPK